MNIFSVCEWTWGYITVDQSKKYPNSCGCAPGFTGTSVLEKFVDQDTKMEYRSLQGCAPKACDGSGIKDNKFTKSNTAHVEGYPGSCYCR